MPTIDNLMQELGLAELPEDKKISLLSAMTESVLKRITVEVLSRLSDEDQSKLLSLENTAPDLQEIEKFLKAKIPDYDQIQNKVLQEFKEEMKSTMDILQAA